MIRVILDFSCIQYQLDKYVWFAVDRLAFSSIKCLKESICNKFNLANIQLYVKNALLRDEDTVLLLRDEDTVKVFQKASETYVSKNFVELPKKSSRKRQMTCSFDCSNEEKHGHAPNDILSSPEGHLHTERVVKKKKKHRKRYLDSEMLMPVDKERSYNEELDQINLSPIPSANAQMDYIVTTSVPKIKIITSTNEISDKKNDSFTEIIGNNNNDTQGLVEQADVGCNEVTVNNTSQDLAERVGIDSLKSSKCRKRKRRRRRKRKDLLDQNNSVSKCELLENSQNIKSINNADILSKLEPVNGSEKNGKGNKHIKFPESSDSSFDKEEFANASIAAFINSFREPKSNSVSVPGLFTTQMHHLSCESEELKNNGSEKYDSDDPKASSTFFKVSSAKSSPQHLSSSYSASKIEVREKKKESSEKSKYVPLNIPPSIGAHIAYKMLELDAMYCPVVSDYKEGVVKKIDQFGNIEIELFNEEVKKSRCGKFEVEFDDCEPEPEIIKIVSVNWSSMIDPQAINA